MDEFEKQIKDIEDHIVASLSGGSNPILNSLMVGTDTEVKALDRMRDIYTEFGPSLPFIRIYKNYINRLKSTHDSFLKDFQNNTGVGLGAIQFSLERKLKGKAGVLRPSRRRLNNKYRQASSWNIPLEDYIKTLNFKKYNDVDSTQVNYDISRGLFTPTLRSLTDISIEDLLQQTSIRILDKGKLVCTGFTGVRTKEYGGDVYHSLAYSDEGKTFDDQDLIRSSFKKYHFDLSCLVSAVTISSKFSLEDFSIYDTGLDCSKQYYLGTFVCLATRHFSHFSNTVPSPFVYMKPVVALFEDEGWVHYSQTEWQKVPSTLLSTCLTSLSDALYRGY